MLCRTFRDNPERKQVGLLGCFSANLVGMHDVFHVSMLRKYIAYPDHFIEYKLLEIHEGLTYEEVPIRILDRKEKVLRIKRIPIVKVLWCNHGVEEASWEAK